MNKVVILNGAPGSGKDTIANALVPNGFSHREVKRALFDQALALSQINELEWFGRYNNRELKEAPWDRLGGLSQREFMIKISEEYVKPILGNNFYGVQAANEAKRCLEKRNVVFSDGGFQEEFNTIRDEVGKENILLVRLHRDGCSFKGDSRGFLSHPEFEMDLYNNGSIENAVREILKRVY